MPIKFYKTMGEPVKTFPGSEEIHFSDNGYIYVADLNGNQQLMYRTAIEDIVQQDSKSIAVTEIGGDKTILRFDFYSTEESNNRFIPQDNPMIGEYKIYHEGYQPPGMMTQIEKQKLLGISPGAEVNQNTYSIVKADNIMLNSRNKTDTLTLIPGTGVNFSVNQANREITINASAAFTSPLEAMSDVNIAELQDGDIIAYDSKTGEWKNSYLITEEIYLKSPNGSLWAIGVQNDGSLYVESANLV